MGVLNQANSKIISQSTEDPEYRHGSPFKHGSQVILGKVDVRKKHVHVADYGYPEDDVAYQLVTFEPEYLEMPGILAENAGNL